MRKNIHLALCVGALALALAACNDPNDTATVAKSYGPSPTLPPSISRPSTAGPTAPSRPPPMA